MRALAIICSFAALVCGCTGWPTDSGSEDGIGRPDYRLPESSFAPLGFDDLAMDAVDDHAGRYILFEGYYSGIVPDPPLVYKGRKKVAKDLQAFYLREEKHSRTYVRVVYPDVHAEDVKAIIPLNRHRSQLKVFAYVLSSQERAALKNGKRLRPFDEPLVWLIRVEITFDDGIHYRRQ